MESQEVRPKGLLFHYTSTEGLIGILRSGHIFATHIRYLNDSQEMFDALDHADDFISQLIDDESTPRMKAFLESAVRSFGRAVGAYVVSFTDDTDALTGTEQIAGDRLNQWRAYSTPGRGFSLGFDARVIDAAGLGLCIEGIDVTAFLHDCIYKRDLKRGVLQRTGSLVAGDWLKSLSEQAAWLFNESLEHGETESKWMRDHLRSHGFPPEIRSQMEGARRKVMMGIALNAMALKSEAFFEEKEWRIIVLGPVPASDGQDSKIKFRNGAVGLTPYFEFPLNLTTPRSPLRRIVVGPTPHMDEVVVSTKMLLNECGIPLRADDCPYGVEVISSQIPFRYW